MAKLTRAWPVFVLILLAWLQPVRAELRLSTAEEKAFFDKYVTPAVERFAKIPALHFTSRLQGDSSLRWELDYIWNTNTIVLARIYLTNRITFTVAIEGTNCAVRFYNNAKINPLGIAGDESPERAKHFGKLPSLLDEVSAYKLAREFFAAAGHKKNNFRDPEIWQLGWGDPADHKNYISLPFYQFTWNRSDVDILEPGNIFYPRVRIVISGLTREVLSYSRFCLPVTGDFDPTDPASHEDAFLESIVFPATRNFCRLSGIPFEYEIRTNDVIRWRFDYVWNTRERVAVSLSLAGDKHIGFRLNGTNCEMRQFSDRAANPQKIVESTNIATAKLYSEMTNRFTLDSALLFTEEFVKAAGENLGNFRLMRSWQITWGDPSDKTNHMLLPFYEFQWIEKNVKEPEAGVLYPSIHVIVSGITKKVVSYDRLQMPVVTDEALRKRYSTNSTEIYRPIPASDMEAGKTSNTN